MRKQLFLITFAFFNAGFLFSQSLGDSHNAAIQRYFDYEGNDPYFSDNELHFSALQSKYLSPNGHGWRNELKKKTELRKSMYTTSEKLSASVRALLSTGAKTIIVQYHDNKQSTLVKIFVADIKNGKLINGIASDGIFDVYAVICEPDGNEKTFPCIAIRSGDTFHETIENTYGNIKIQINDTVISDKSNDCEAVYLKFGNYLQAQDPITARQETDHDAYDRFYKQLNIFSDTVIYKDTVYTAN